MAAHRAPSTREQTTIRAICVGGFTIGWIAWLIMRGIQTVVGVEDLTTYPAGIALVMGACRIAESGTPAIVSPQTRES